VVEGLSKAGQSARTRSALILSARRLFADRGFEGVSSEEIAADAGVTTGALYHQFKTKRDVFRAAFEAVEAELTARVGAAAAGAADPWEGLMAAVAVFLDAALADEVRQIVVIDGLSVIGWPDWEEVMGVYGLGVARAALGGLMAAGYIEQLPVDALAHLMLGALNEGAMAIATAEDPATARDEVGTALAAIMNGLRRGRTLAD
jgi:AcrR family transcriptional regulator